MSQREALAPVGLAETASQPVSDDAALSSSTLCHDVIRELVTQADRLGLLHSYPLPANMNSLAGDHGRRSKTDWHSIPILGKLLAGHIEGLEPLAVKLVTMRDAALDATQREAVARALSTPDVCLIRGPAGTGKSRVVAEIITQAATLGKRVLLLSPTRAALDRVLELTANHDAVCPVRCLAGDEDRESHANPARFCTYEAGLHHLREVWLQRAREHLRTAEQRHERCLHDGIAWPQFEELAEEQKRLQQQLRDLDGERERIPQQVENEAGEAEADRAGLTEFVLALRACVRTRDEALKQADVVIQSLQDEIEASQRQQLTLTTLLGELQPLAQARQNKRWWTANWWRALLRGKVAARMTELEGQQAQVLSGISIARQKIDQVTHDKEDAGSAFQRERGQTIASEICRRQAEIDRREAELQRQQSLLDEAWRNQCDNLLVETPRPAARVLEAIQAARITWQQQLQQDEARLSFAHQWVACLEDQADTLPVKFTDYVNLVAATPSGLINDKHFGESAGWAVSFDMLIVEEVHELREADFLKIARHASKWVLVGEPPSLSAPCATTDNQPSAASSAGFFQQLWRHLHFDPRRLPYAWVHEGKRLCCKLRSLDSEQRRWIETERLADFAEIELRILAAPHSQSTLAEVVFPASITLRQAKEFIFKELQELSIQSASSSFHWIENADQIILSFGDGSPQATEAVSLEPGVREFLCRTDPANNGNIGSVPWSTCRLEFDHPAWDRQRAENWVREHAGFEDPGRTVSLNLPYRMQPGLATFISNLLYDGGYHVPHTNEQGPALCADCQAVNHAGGPEHVEFVAVNLPVEDKEKKHSKHERKKSPPPANRLVKGGAGLEFDLANLLHREAIPAELSALLPDRGLVNYVEAQAVVRKLKELLADPAFRTAATAWQHLDGCNPGYTCNGRAASARGPQTLRPRLALAVIALYPAQAELIRCLLEGCTEQASPDIRIEIGLPEAFRQRESLLTLISLTRSHHHRAVLFGNHPRELALALTRASGRMLLFGDLGTLMRRSQWQGPLDHLDEVGAAVEARLIGRLVSYVQGHAGHQTSKRE